MSESNGWVANRSPTGMATATSVWREDDGWYHHPERSDIRFPRGEKVYASKQDAVLAARFRWNCTQGRPRGPRPKAFATT